MADEPITPCPFCGDAMQVDEGLLQHVDESHCIIGWFSFELAKGAIRKWNARSLFPETQGHNMPCYYCAKPCDSYAGNPNLWPVAACHMDEPGVVKWHHTGCIMERIGEA